MRNSGGSTWRNLSLALLGGALLAASLPGPALAQQQDRPVTPGGALAGAPTVVVSGTGEVRLAPDRADVRLGVTRQAKAAQEAQTQVNAVAQRMLEALGKLGIKPQQIQTSQLTLMPVYEQRDEPNNEPLKVVAYQASNLVTVRLEKLAQVGPVIDAAVGAGANQVEGIDFSLNSDLEARARALRQAVEEARRKATAIAEALGSQVVSVLEVQEGGISIRPPMFNSDVAMMKMESSTPVSPGEVAVSASVTIRYQLRGR